MQPLLVVEPQPAANALARLRNRAIRFDEHVRILQAAPKPLDKDIVQEPPLATPIRGKIELRNVCFRYAETERFVLENINLKVSGGSNSLPLWGLGSGKNQLLKIISVCSNQRAGRF